MITSLWNRYPYYLNIYKHVFIWKVKKRLNDLWLGYNTEQYNIFAYFTEIIKRLFAETYNNLDKIKIEYFQVQRKEKIQKINSLL